MNIFIYDIYLHKEMGKYVFSGDIYIYKSNNCTNLDVTFIFMSLNSCKENMFLPRNPFPSFFYIILLLLL